MRTTLLTAALVATTACGGGGEGVRNEIVVCSAGWEAEFPNVPLNGKCERSCRDLPATKILEPCDVAVILNGEPTLWQCGEIGGGVVVDDGGRLVCCSPEPTTTTGAEWQIVGQACE